MYRTLALLLALLPTAALAQKSASAEPASEATPSESQLAVYRALSGRHFEAGCDALKGLSPTLADDLIWLAENSHQTAWVAVRRMPLVVAFRRQMRLLF